MSIDTTVDPTPDLSAPPSSKLSPAAWMRINLFANLKNTIISLLVGVALLALLIWAVNWIIGADFRIMRVNLRQFMVGQFPSDELWRLWVSGYIFVGGIALTGGALARSSYETDVEMEVEAEKEGWLSLLQRFWIMAAVMIFFVSFARTAKPFIGLAIVFVVVFVLREVGWRLPATIRSRIVFIGATLVVISLLVIAGTSSLAGATLGLIAAAWAISELGQVTLPSGVAGKALALGGPLAIGAIVWLITWLIPFDGFGWESWGGLHISLFTTIVGIALGMPFGILLALGRKSQLPVIQTASTIFIEFVRGVPLISLLLFSNLMLPFFFPIDFSRPADLTLAIIVITGFSAAYIAEIVRGGLQAVPRGQTEAAQASGMSPGAVQRLIVLPQALRAVIPAMVGQFISLFKDSSLLSIIGISEILNASARANAQNEFVGKNLAPVTYFFVAIAYWAFAYTMSKESRRLESKLGVGVR